MGQKRITRAEAQRGMDLIVRELENCHSYAEETQDRVRAELGSTSIPPQREGDILENEERRNKHYKEVSEILMTRAKEEAEKGTLKAEAFRSAERITYMRRDELERLKLEKTDPELDERQWRMLSDLKARLVEYPVLLGEVTGDKAFLQGVKKSYESKLEGYEAKLERLIDDVYGLHMTCSDHVETSLEGFAERTLKPAINIVKLQHERLETELGEADVRSKQLDRRIEELEAEAEDARAEKMRLYRQHEAREESLAEEIAAMKKKLEGEKQFNQAQEEKHKRETTDLKAQLEKTRTTADKEVTSLQAELQSYSEDVKELREEKEKLEKSGKVWRERVDARRQELSDLKAKCKTSEEQLETAQEQLFSLQEALEAEKEAAESMKEMAEQEKESLRNESRAVKEARNSAESEVQSIKSQLMTERNANANESQSFQTQLSSVKSEYESLKHSFEIRYGRATEISELMFRLLQWHISTFDNMSMEKVEAKNVFSEMGEIVGTMEQYPGSAAEMASMPKYIPGMTLLRKATELSEPNLAAARRLWISSRCGSLALDVAQAFFMQEEIPSAQFALLPWIHASLNRAVMTMCERSTLTPDLASSLLWILQGLVYTATIAREWSEDYAWIPNVVEMLAKIKGWLREHVPSDEASFLTMIADQVNDIVVTQSPSTSISPNLFAEAQRMDSANSDIPNDMAMVIDNSGMIILFTADDNAFVFGANEVKVVDLDNQGNVVFIFESQLSGLPENLREIRLHDCGRPEAVIPHERLLNSVLPSERLVVVSFRKYHR